MKFLIVLGVFFSGMAAHAATVSDVQSIESAICMVGGAPATGFDCINTVNAFVETTGCTSECVNLPRGCICGDENGMGCKQICTSKGCYIKCGP